MNKKEAKDRIEKLRKLIDQYRYEYHVLDKSTISDEALDSLKKELFDLEQEYPDLITPDSPTQRVAGKPIEGFTKVTHPQRMLSLNDVFSEQDVREWKERVDTVLGASYTKGYYCDLKMDGLAVELHYVDEVLEQASTRGDGLVGEDVTQNIRTVQAVPIRLQEGAPSDLYVRGEVFLTKKEFKRINHELQEKGEKPYANPRNLAAGTIRQLDPRVTAGRKLSFFAYAIVGRDQGTYAQEYADLKAFGFPINRYGSTVPTLEEVIDFQVHWEKERESLDYEVDGVVVSIADIVLYRKAGIIGKAPRGSVAFKFAPRQAETIVEDIQVQVGRTGVMTPVAHLRPVQIGGTTVSRATLHNLDEIERLGVRIGDTVIVGRAGDVIPDIIKVLPELRTGKEQKFRMPTKCPICKTAIVRNEGQVAFYCPNPDCPAKRREAVYHFVSRNAINMEGIGPQTIDQLMDAGLVSDAADLYMLGKEDLLNLERFAEVSAGNVIETIASRKTIPLSRFIYALGIEHVGEETARALAVHFQTLAKLRAASDEKLLEVPDIGPTVSRSIQQWFSRPYNRVFLDKFSRAGVRVTSERAVKGKFSGMSFVVTGTLEQFSREQAEGAIRALGGKVASAVSKETSYVVVGAKPGSKFDKAKKLGVKILDEDQFKKMVS